MAVYTSRLTNEELLATFTRDEVKAHLLNLYMYESEAKWDVRLKSLQAYQNMMNEDANNPFTESLSLTQRVEMLRKLIPVDELIALVKSMPAKDRQLIKDSL